MLFRLFFISGLSLLLISCSTIKPYRYQDADNLVINTITDEHIQTAIDIFDAQNPCQLKYQGTIQVKQASMTTGLPVNKHHYLVINFSSSSMWSGEKNMAVEAVLKPQKGFKYQYDLNYKDNIYNVELREINSSTGRIRVRESDLLQTCQ